MDEPKPKRSWYRRKRWWVVVAIWLVPLWAASAGPAFLAVRRGWLPPGIYQSCFVPAALLIRETPARSAYRDYLFSWSGLPRADKGHFDTLWRTAEEEAASDTAAVVEDAAIVRRHWTPPKAAP